MVGRVWHGAAAWMTTAGFGVCQVLLGPEQHGAAGEFFWFSFVLSNSVVAHPMSGMTRGVRLPPHPWRCCFGLRAPRLVVLCPVSSCGREGMEMHPRR